MSAPDTRGLVLQLLVSLSLASEQPWSPIVGGGRGLSANQRPGSSHYGPISSLTFPPLLPASNLIVHSPLRRVTSDISLPSGYHYDHRHYSDSGRRQRRTRPHYREPYRRNYRRRRRYYRVRDPRSRYRRVSSQHSPAASSSLAVTRERLEGRARSVEAEGEGRSFVRNVRNLFGAQEHCLEGGRQYSCTLAPVCWMTGGVASPGDDDDDNLDRRDDIDPDTVLVTILWSV